MKFKMNQKMADALEASSVLWAQEIFKVMSDPKTMSAARKSLLESESECDDLAKKLTCISFLAHQHGFKHVEQACLLVIMEVARLNQARYEFRRQQQ